MKMGISGSIRAHGLASWELRVYSGCQRRRKASVSDGHCRREPRRCRTRTCRACGIGSIRTVGWL